MTFFCNDNVPEAFDYRFGRYALCTCMYIWYKYLVYVIFFTQLNGHFFHCSGKLQPCKPFSSGVQVKCQQLHVDIIPPSTWLL